MKIEEISLLAQLVDSTDLAARKLETFFQKRDVKNFNKAKEEILAFQKQISKILENGA